EILRTRFVRQPGSRLPIQAPAGGVVWDEKIDLSSLPSEEQTTRFDQLCAVQAERYADWEESPALRLQLVQLGVARHRLLLNLCPVCGDGVTMGLLVQAVASAYASLPGTDRFLYEGLQYSQFGEWQNDLVETPDPMLEEAKAYWSSRPARPAGSGLPV